MTEFCQLAGTEKLRTSIYHPQCNGAAERFNRSLLKLLGTMPQNHKRDWKNYIHAMTHAHNSLRCTATGFSPFYLMFGREPQVPLDAFLPSLVHPVELHRSYVRRFQERMNWVFEQAHQHQSHEIERMKPYMSRRATASKLEVGDHVLVRVLKFDGRHKLANHWESEPYAVVSQLEGLPVFRVRLAADSTAPHRTLHRNHLLKLTTNLFNLSKEKKNEIRTGRRVEEHSAENLDVTSVVAPAVPAATQSEDEEASTTPWHSLPAEQNSDGEGDDLTENDMLELGLHLPGEAANGDNSLRRSTRVRRPVQRYGYPV